MTYTDFELAVARHRRTGVKPIDDLFMQARWAIAYENYSA